MSRSPTKTSTPRLSEVARHVVAPKGVVSTGWPAVERKCADLGVTFRWWQKPIGQIILAKRADGKYAATIGGTGMSIPRQVGKTYLVGALIFALCLLRPGLTVIWTAHRLRTAEETFGKMQKFAGRASIAPHVLKVTLGSGEQSVEFRNGSRILFGARERGFGRGFDEVDVAVYDEAQILTEAALADIIPAMNQSRQAEGALLLFMGTPPRLGKDPGEVFTRMRSEALSGDDPDTGWIEFGADPGYVFTPLPADLSDRDWKQVAKANPSYPDDTPRESILRMRKKLGADLFLGEGAGIWPDASTKGGVFGDLWPALADAKAERGPRPVFAVSVAPDRSWSAVAVAWVRPDGATHVMLADYRPSTDWVAARVAELRGTWGGTVVASTTARGLVPGAVEPPQGEQALAHTGLDDAVTAGTVRHGNEPALNTAVRGARWKAYGDTRQFDRKGSLDISPLDAAALAVKAAGSADDLPPNIW